MRELRVEKDLGEGQRATRPQAVEDKSLSHKTEIDGWLQLIKPRASTCAWCARRSVCIKNIYIFLFTYFRKQ